MKKLIAVVLLFAAVAYADENLIGKIIVSDAGYSTNYSTGYATAGCQVGESCNQAFALPSAKLITIQCDAAAVVAIGRASNDAGIGLSLAAGQMLFTDTGKALTRGVTQADGGTYTGAVISIAPAPGATTATCSVHSRTGLE